MSERLNQLLRGYLEAQAGQPLPPAVAAVVEQLVTFGLQAAVTLIQDDYVAEIDTIAGSLELTMRSHGFSY